MSGKRPEIEKLGEYAGKNRPGTVQRATAAAKENVLEVFERLGGAIAMTAWARENPDVFYGQIYAKLIPREVAGKLEVETREIKTLDATEIHERTRAHLERRASAADDSVRH